ncbi:hypothetical protein RB601_005766 [Gaeumannomyces tritici]
MSVAPSFFSFPKPKQPKPKPLKSLIDECGLSLPLGPVFDDSRAGGDFRNGLQKKLGHLDQNKLMAVLCSIFILANEHGEILYKKGEVGFYTALKYALGAEGAVVEAFKNQVDEEHMNLLDQVCLVPLNFTVRALTGIIDKLVEARRQHLIQNLWTREPKSLLVYFIDNFRWSAYDKWEMHPTLHRPLLGEGWRADGSYWWRPNRRYPEHVYPALRDVEMIHPPGYLAQHPELQARVQAAQREEDLDLDDPEALEKFLAEEDEEEEEEEEDMVMEDTVMEDTVMEDATA